MGKKKFIDKKKSATFQLLARDSSNFVAGDEGDDRVFFRVDNNPYSISGIADDNDDDSDPDAIYADAPGDIGDEEICPVPVRSGSDIGSSSSAPLSDAVRRQILELGLPDDGYNYLLHLREIKNSGGGSAYYHNSKARLDCLPVDVKAYDASRLRITGESKDSMYVVASKTVGVNVPKVVDPDLERLLDDDDLSRFESDMEDLEEDFVLKANQPEGDEEEEEEEEEVVVNVMKGDTVETRVEVATEMNSHKLDQESESSLGNGNAVLKVNEKTRVPRLLDEEFDNALREYDSEHDSDEDGFVLTEKELIDKLGNAFKNHPKDALELDSRDIEGSGIGELLEIPADVVRRCVEYAEAYCDNKQDDEDVVLVSESSDESEVWDCETIVSTYSNLDNHPGKIKAPENPKKKSLFGNLTIKNSVITLRGKEKLPVEFLPHNKKSVEMVKTEVESTEVDSTEVDSGNKKPKRKLLSKESKEEKKERKAAVKGERREARQAKKELKGLYRCEAQKAQKVAAVAGPPSIHLM